MTGKVQMFLWGLSQSTDRNLAVIEYPTVGQNVFLPNIVVTHNKVFNFKERIKVSIEMQGKKYVGKIGNGPGSPSGAVQ